MARNNEKNLSDTRGSRLGISFFKVWLKVFGLTHTCVMVWVITFFYTFFDNRAKRKLIPYVKHRFPEDGRIMRHFRIWAIFAHQGISLLLLEALKLKQITCEVTYYNEESRKLRYASTPAVLLYSHEGPWQVAMSTMDLEHNKLTILMKEDLNPNMQKMHVLKNDPRLDRITLVSPNAAGGGLLEMSMALERGEFVAIMGDRCLEMNPAAITFLGEKAYFPMAGFFLAARHQVPLCFLFASMNWKEKKVQMEFGKIVYPQMPARNREALLPYLAEYVREIEKRCMNHPYDCFLFNNVWSADTK